MIVLVVGTQGTIERAEVPVRETAPAPRKYHDALFRGVFGHPEHAAALVREVLPERLAARLDLDRLEACPSNFVDEKLRWLYADVLFKAPLVGQDRFVYVQIEHQSGTDRSMAYRMLCYMTGIWAGHRTDNPYAEKPPAVIPVVVHTGRRPWRAPIDLDDGFDLDTETADAFGKCLPRLEFLLDDLAVTGEPSLRARRLGPLPRVALLLLEYGPGNPNLINDLYRWTEDFRAVLDGPNGVPELVTCLTYIEAVGNVPPDELRDLFTHLGPQAKDAYMTTAEQLRTEGEARGRTGILLDLLQLKFGPLSPDLIDRVKAAPLDQITTWTRRFITAETLDDVLD